MHGPKTFNLGFESAAAELFLEFYHGCYTNVQSYDILPLVPLTLPKDYLKREGNFFPVPSFYLRVVMT